MNVIIYWSSNNSNHENYLKLSLFWLSLIINFIVQANSQLGVDNIVLGYAFSVIPLSLLSYSSLAFVREKYPWKWMLPLALLCIFTTIVLLKNEYPFTITALPTSAAGAIPLFYCCYIYLFKQRRLSSPLIKFHAIILFALGIHSFNFAFFRMVEGAQLWGWPVAYALYQILAGLIPALTLDFYHRNEEERLNEIINERTLQLTDSNNALKSALQQKMYLFRTLTHDISTPLSIARMTIDLFQPSKSSIENFTRRISDLNLRMENLVHQVRSFESIQSGIKTFELKEENLLTCVKSVESMFENRLAEKNIKCIYDKSLLNQVEILVDSDSFINSVLMNLVSNSIKFCHQGGKIYFSAKQQNNEKINFTVEDNGIGMPEHIMHNLFDFDAQTSRKGTKNEAGTGFGAPIVKKIIEAYGGNISVTSKEKSSANYSFTRFHIILSGNIGTASTKTG
ncbi:MAG: HAMP domain-containing histidine kinase [Bdellovibrionales bacterium]|nr:HAMP domain-containing histidine kinase [Bdellovibrionales bacterium]